MLKIAQARMDETIANNDMVGIHVSRELNEAATKKLETTFKQQSKVSVDIGKK